MEKKVKKLKRWEQTYARFIFTVLIAVLCYRLFNEWVVPTFAIDSQQLQLMLVWAFTAAITVATSELFKKIICK